MLVTEPPGFDGACWMPHEETIRALMIEQDHERARLRAQTAAYRQALLDADITPPDDNGAALLDANRNLQRAVEAVYQHFGCDGWTLRGLPADLAPFFEPLRPN